MQSALFKKVGIVGLGYVGLPLAAAFARSGFSVTGIDVDPVKTAALNRGRSHVLDVPSRLLEPLVRKKRFSAVQDFKAVSALDAVIICVPTPLKKSKEPDLSFIIAAGRQIAPHLRRGQLIVLESTTYPGTTEEVLLPILEKFGLRAEKDFYLAFSPERVDPGNRHYDTISIPKVIGGVGPRSLQAAQALYSQVIKTVVPVSSAKTAEMVKLLENTYRSVNIGLINEIAIICNRLGVDIWEVVEAAKTKPFGFMGFYPGPGPGGHCLPIDPLYLSWKSKRHGFEAKMIELAALINESMPDYVVKRVTELLNSKKISHKNAPVLVLGAAYKKNINDWRESPALGVIEGLLRVKSRVSYSDPLVPAITIGRLTLRSKPVTPALLKKQACVVLVTDHDAFDKDAIVRHSKLIFDTRNALRKLGPQRHVFYL